ncbi:hypothetical protein HK096_003584 [Nowakowskiella sp. JEL0078]|nr:hypothetical protein HK096_003584 [Nowakowskiella sp. JEL0078]
MSKKRKRQVKPDIETNFDFLDENSVIEENQVGDSGNNESEQTSSNLNPRVLKKLSNIPPYTDFYSQEDLNTAIRIFELYNLRPELKIEARRTSDVAKLFGLARKAVLNRSDWKNLPVSISGPKRRRTQNNESDSKKLDRCKLRNSRILAARGGTSGGFLGLSLSVSKDLVTLTQMDQPLGITSGVKAIDLKAVNEADEFIKLNTLKIEYNEEIDPNETETNSNIKNFVDMSEFSDNYSPGKLNCSKRCYICKKSYKELHHFYDQLCIVCGNFNFSKRYQVGHADGRVCLVTGGRLKIGFFIALQLLRSNASSVIITSRFPLDTMRRFSSQPDFNQFKGRLTVYAVDFRSLGMVSAFAKAVIENWKRLDVLINNAAQTVRRPPDFYTNVLKEEAITEKNRYAITHLLAVVDVKIPAWDFNGRQWRFECLRTKLDSEIYTPPAVSAAMSQVPVLDSDFDESKMQHQSQVASSQLLLTDANSVVIEPLSNTPVQTESEEISKIENLLIGKSQHFPPTIDPWDGQQIDLRPKNSWSLLINEIETPEILETHYINVFAPLVLITNLLPLIEASKQRPNTDDTINVSAMEGQFHRKWKSPYHVHTNMAKGIKKFIFYPYEIITKFPASLNMLTRTSAADLSSRNIFMTAVDTGWVTNENPIKHADTSCRKIPPIDELDGASRVLDPVFIGLNGGKKMWGVFLKDYQVTVW